MHNTRRIDPELSVVVAGMLNLHWTMKRWMEFNCPCFLSVVFIRRTCSQGCFIPLKTACKSDAWREHFCLFFKIWPRTSFAPVFGSYESGIQLTLSSCIWSLLYPDVLRFLGKCCIACVWVFILLSNGGWQRQTGDDLFVLVQMPHCSSQSGFIITEEYWQIRMPHFSPLVHHSNGSCMLYITFNSCLVMIIMHCMNGNICIFIEM